MKLSFLLDYLHINQLRIRSNSIYSYRALIK
uniref:Uncharacterized protein n=1 Tax=Rhizophora mucronata TaxID=61149 RepID=A0A2P2QZN3_RHIMU